jgi:TatD DNase family protein
MSHPRVIAWGECGLDYHYDHSPRDVQRTIFARQIQCAVKVNKPLVVHSRSAEQVIAIRPWTAPHRISFVMLYWY